MASCTILNVTGDVTIAWDDENSKDIKNWIESKLKEGCTFFIVEKKFGFIPIKKKISSAIDLPSKGEVKISDSDAASFFKTESKPLMKNNNGNNLKLGDIGAESLVQNGFARAMPKEKSVKNKVKKIALNAQEIMKNDTMCTKRMMGG